MGIKQQASKATSRRQALGNWLALLIWFLILCGFLRASTEDLHKDMREFLDQIAKKTKFYETPALLHHEDAKDKIVVIFVKVKGAEWRVWYQRVGNSPVNALVIGRPEGVRSMAFERWSTSNE